ncbi:unnamed protein product, partial [marine sediment metagenome]
KGVNKRNEKINYISGDHTDCRVVIWLLAIP